VRSDYGNVSRSAPSTRNHGLITGWRNFGVLSKRMEAIVDPNESGFLVSTVSRKRSNQTELRAYNRTTVVSILTGGQCFRQRLALGPSMRNHSLEIIGLSLTAWEQLSVRLDSASRLVLCRGSVRLSYGLYRLG
jgi:hypothetical protein